MNDVFGQETKHDWTGKCSYKVKTCKHKIKTRIYLINETREIFYPKLK